MTPTWTPRTIRPPLTQLEPAPDLPLRGRAPVPAPDLWAAQGFGSHSAGLPVRHAGEAGVVRADEAPQSASLLPREPHAAVGILAVMAGPTATPTPNPSGPGCHKFTYRLKYDRPSKMASLKNALGAAVSLFIDYLPPGTGAQSDWPDPTTTNVNWQWNTRTSPDWDNGGGITYAVLTEPETGLQNEWRWTIDWGFDVFGGIIYRDDPGIPFTAYDSSTDMTGGSIPDISGMPITAVTPGTWTILAPQDVVGKNAGKVNWGLETFGDIAPDALYPNFCSYADNYKLVVPLDPGDTGVTACSTCGPYPAWQNNLENALKLKYYGGLDVAGGTPTKGALAYGKKILQQTFDPAIYPNGISNVIGPDPKGHCDRAYGVILCTDGLSNTCNPDGSGTNASPGPGSNWVSPCTNFYPAAGCFNPADPIFGKCCDLGSDPLGAGTGPNGHMAGPPNDCTTEYINTYTYFAPGESESMFNSVLTHGGAFDSKIQPRTFVIGISPIVGKCELNYTAYRGMTDASSPNGDAGFTRYDPLILPPLKNGDPRLRWVGENGTSPDRYGINLPSGKDYAFFALDARAMAKAFTKIVNSPATGDYATSPPVSGNALAAGNIVLLPSTEFPSWNGHLYAFDTSKLPSDPGYVVWDAGQRLAVRNGVTNPRMLFTWDPANSNALVPIDRTNAATLATLAGVPYGTAAEKTTWLKTIDFIQGFTGGDPVDPVTLLPAAVTERDWIMGPAINATPAVIGRPTIYRQSNLPPHATFEATYATRTGLTWVGADDGFLHAFNFANGDEVLGLMPPNVLPNQPLLWQNYKAGESSTGQNTEIADANDPASPNRHLWGVASSVRYYDMYTGLATGYKTVGILTLGPAGDTIAAVDITHPTPGDPNYDALNPVKILWSNTAASPGYAGLKPTWSVPAMGATAFDKVRVFSGAGLDGTSTAGSQVDQKFFVIDPLTGTGTVLQSKTLLHETSPAPLVGEQAFADSVVFSTVAPGFFSDNIVDLALQNDTTGQVWFNYGATFGNINVGMDLSDKASQSQPLYYSAAANGIGRTGCQVYGIGSGSFYETKPAVSGKINGGPDGNFSPSIYVAVNDKKNPNFNVQVPNAQIVRTPLNSILRPAGDPNPTGNGGKLGNLTQLTGAPFLLAPLSGTGTFNALFLAYDPENGCQGYSYVIIQTFTITSCTTVTITATDVFGAGAGAASGFALAGTEVVVAKSGIGQGQSAGLYKPGVSITTFGGSGAIGARWWKEWK